MTKGQQNKIAERHRTQQKAAVIIVQSPNLSLKELRKRLKQSGFTHPVSSKEFGELRKITKWLLANPGTGHARVDSSQLARVLRRIHAQKYNDEQARLLIEKLSSLKTVTRSKLEDAYGCDAVAVLGDYLQATSTTTRKPGKFTVVKPLPSLVRFYSLRSKCFTHSVWAALSQAHAAVSEEFDELNSQLDDLSDGARNGVRGEALDERCDAVGNLMFTLLPGSLKSVLGSVTFTCREAVYSNGNNLKSALVIIKAVLTHFHSITSGLGAISQLDGRFGKSKAAQQVVTQMMVLQDELAEFVDELEDAVDTVEFL